MKETDLAYLAGMIDGEGSISIFEHGGRPNLVCQVYATDETVLLWMKETFGGRIHQVGRRMPRSTWKQEYTWVMGPQHAAKVLGACLPYLKIKRVQAELFISHAATSARYGKGGIPLDIRKKRMEIMATMQALNKRGSNVAITRNPDGSPRT